MATRRNTDRGRGRGRGVNPVEREPPVAPAQPVRFTKLCKEYTQLGGKQFAGSESIVEAQKWLNDLERIFSGLEITDAQKRQMAAWQLKDVARNLWESITAHATETDFTWQQFRYILSEILFLLLSSFFDPILNLKVLGTLS